MSLSAIVLTVGLVLILDPAARANQPDFSRSRWRTSFSSDGDRRRDIEYKPSVAAHDGQQRCYFKVRDNEQTGVSIVRLEVNFRDPEDNPVTRRVVVRIEPEQRESRTVEVKACSGISQVSVAKVTRTSD